MKSVLILGGYGNFGKRIATALVKAGIPIIITGRNKDKAQKLLSVLKEIYPACNVKDDIFDVKLALAERLKELRPAVVINTVGPFQTSNYDVVKICIQHKVHYIDLADGRDFVVGISKLDRQAKKAGVAVISGASTVPGLSSAVLEKYRNEFSVIKSLTYGISPGQKAERGLTTTKAILTYIGKQLKPAYGSSNTYYGWQDIYQQEYPELGKRWMANCDIPDLDLLPQKYGIKNIRFFAGMESSILHLGIWLISWLVRMKLLLHLSDYSLFLLRMSHLFDWLGTADGGMHIIIKGRDQDGKPKEFKWFIIAKNGDGPQIPSIPAIILAKKLLFKELDYIGASACVGLVSLDEYMNELEEFNIETYN